IGLKLPPYITPEQIGMMPSLAQMILKSKAIGFIITSNTIPDHIPKDERGNNILVVPGGAGGMSGPGTKEEGMKELEMWYRLLGRKKNILSTLGVDSGKEVLYRIRNGADLAGGVTIFTESSNWGNTVNRILTEFATEEG